MQATDTCAPCGCTSTSISRVSCHTFVHAPGNLSNSLVPLAPLIKRADSTGGQLGFGQSWNLSYLLDNDSNATMKIFGPGVTFPGADLFGFVQQPTNALNNPNCQYYNSGDVNGVGGVGLIAGGLFGNDCPVKTLVTNTPRPGEGGGGAVTLTEVWDLRTSTGAVVPNGIYTVWGAFVDGADSGDNFARNGVATPLCPPKCPSTTTSFRGYLTDIPVNTLRITNFSAAGISAPGQQGQISYTTSGDANIRIVIAFPGSGFVLDVNGDIQPTNPATGVIDCTRIVNVPGSAQAVPAGAPAGCGAAAYASFNKKAGSYSDAKWTGVLPNGFVLPNGTIPPNGTTLPGIYSVGISAKDAFGNVAMYPTTNNGPLVTTLPVDFTPAPVNPMTLSSLSVAGGNVDITKNTAPGQTTINPSFSQISAIFSNPLGSPGPAPAADSIVLTSTSCAISAGSIIIGGAANNTLIVSAATPNPLPTPLGCGGAVTAVINAVDNSSPPQTLAGSPVTVVFSLPAPAVGGGPPPPPVAAPVQQTADQFKNSVVGFPNPVQHASVANLNFNLSNAGNVDFDIFTLSGERLFHLSKSFGAGASTFPWPLTNDSGGKVGTGVFLFRITAHDGNNVFRTTRKLIVIK